MKYQLDDVRSSALKEIILNDIKTKQNKEIEELILSINILREWSSKQKCSVLFDSNIDGDGGNYVLMSKVMNKKNLYYISFDNQNNVFGGYVDTIINKTGNRIIDANSNTFSLIKNRKINNIKNIIKNDDQQYKFYLDSNSSYLYGFGGGNETSVYKAGNLNLYLNLTSYEYNGY